MRIVSVAPVKASMIAGWMYALAADGPGVAEAGRDLRDRFGDLLPERGLGGRSLESRKVWAARTVPAQVRKSLAVEVLGR